MSNSKYSLTPSAIKYLLALLELCQPDKGARCMDIAEYLQVTKPSVHSMICNLCQSGLAEKKKYGAVFLTEQGHAEAERYAACYTLLLGRLHDALGLTDEAARSAACAVLAQLTNELPELEKRLGAQAS